MNSYRSCIRTLTARNLCDLSIAPPASLAITAPDLKTVLFEDGRSSAGQTRFDVNSNITLKRLGVFSNFGDGLVWGTPWVRIALRIAAVPYSVPATPLVGTVSLAVNSTTMTGIGTNFSASLAAGDIVSVAGSFYVVRGSVAALTLELTDFPFAAVAGASVYKVNTPVLIPIATTFYGIENFNCMYDHECWFPASLIGGLNVPNYFLKVDATIEDTLLLMTKTVDTSYAGDTAYFDVKADFEMTVRTT